MPSPTTDPGPVVVGVSPAPDGLQVLGVLGLPDFRPGDDLVAAIAGAAPWIIDGDVLVITSKVLSKTEGRLIPSPADPEERDDFRRQLIDAETVRLVAQIGKTKIVQNHLGLVAAAAGIDASNVHANEIALLPTDPDGSAAELVRAFADRGLRIGVVITDTQGRAWRAGVTDVAIGAAGIAVLDDHRGGIDEHGNHLVVTQVATGDEMAAAADLVKGKLSAVPAAVLRGLNATGSGTHSGGGRELIRPTEEDLFRLGTDLALEQGRLDAATTAAIESAFGEGLVGVATLQRCIGQTLSLIGPSIGDGVEMLMTNGDRQIVVATAEVPSPVPDQASSAPAVMQAPAKAGAALQVLRGLLAAEGIAAHWLSPLPQIPRLPARRAVVAAIEVRLPHPSTSLAEIARAPHKNPVPHPHPHP
ncbi:MAG: coenzyme F420-0:L-glutamate ligase [Actinomycetota bacterium]|nr:coenzyme F420-0:L-glutamate ligase [Actinomycetota bacterium]